MPDRIPLTLSVPEAMSLKWDLGRAHYRRPEQPFVGEPLYEAWEDQLDVTNYVCEELQQRGNQDPEAEEIIERAIALARDIRDLALRRRAEAGQ